MVDYHVGRNMYLIKKPSTLDLKIYRKKTNSLKNFYGLPKKIIFCKKCTYTNQKPNSEQEYKHNINKKKPTLAIEIDGDSHLYKYEYDKHRQGELEKQGVIFLRFSDRDIKHNLFSVLLSLETEIERLKHP